MDNKIIEIAMEVLKVEKEVVENNYRLLEDINAYYIWNPTRGGISMIINNDLEKLAASSVISFEELKEAFISGKRN